MLIRKVLRDLRINATQFIAIFVMTLFAMLVVSGFDSSDGSALILGTKYLEDTNYKDIDIQGIAFNQSHINTLKNTEGVENVNGVLHASGKMLLDEEKLLVMSFITGNEVSKMYVTDGTAYTPGSKGVWVEKIFADAMGLRVGDYVTMKVGEVSFKEQIKGLVYCPEYLYYVPNATYPEPIYGTHGFAIMDISEAPFEDLYYDQLIVDLKGVNGQYKSLTNEEVGIMNSMRDKISGILDDKNVIIKIKKEFDEYNSYTSDSTSTLSIVFSILFLAVSLLGIVTTMTRITEKQRTQIGTMKALGFSRSKITWHYLSYSAIVTLLGAVLGIIIGRFTLGAFVKSSYDYYFQNPYSELKSSMKSIFMPVLAVVLSMITTYFCTNKMLRENASEILRPAAPKEGTTGFIENTKLWEKLKFGTRWNIRDVGRNRLRTVLSILGIVVTSLLLFSAFGFYECLGGMSEWMYKDLIDARYRILFEDDTDYGTVYDYAKEYSGQMVEINEATIYSDSANAIKPVCIVDDGNLYRFQNEDLQYYDLPKSGVMLTSRLKDIFHVEAGDELRIHFPGDPEIYTARIVGFTRQPTSQGIIMSKEAWREIRGEFKPNTIYTNKTVDKSLEKKPEVVAVNDNADMRQALDSSWSIGYTVSIILSALAVVLGIVVLYNLGELSYIEKVREIATMKVLGFPSMQIRKILMQQNFTVTVIGALIGVPLGRVSLSLIIDAFLVEDGDVIMSLSPLPFLVSVLGTFLVSVLVNIYVTSNVNRIDMVEALKGVE